MRLLTFFLVLCLSSLARADDAPYRLGAHLSGGQFTPDAIDGSTGSGSGLSFGLVGTYNLGRDRLYGSLSRAQYSTKATDVEIGQDVIGTEVAVSYQTMWRLSRVVRPWIGVGMGYTKSDYKQRSRLASAGSSFSVPVPDAKTAAFEALVNINFEQAADGQWTPGIQIQAAKAFSGKAAYIRAGVYFLF